MEEEALLHLGQKRGDHRSLQVSSGARTRPSSPDCAGSYVRGCHASAASLPPTLPLCPPHQATWLLLCFLSELNGIRNRIGEVTPERSNLKKQN